MEHAELLADGFLAFTLQHFKAATKAWSPRPPRVDIHPINMVNEDALSFRGGQLPMNPIGGGNLIKLRRTTFSPLIRLKEVIIQIPVQQVLVSTEQK